MTIMIRHITMAQNYENRYEENVHKPVQFLRFVKTTRFPQLRDTPHLTQHEFLSPTREVNLFDLTKFLSEIQTIKRGKRHVKNDHLFKTLLSPVLQKCLRLTEVNRCFQISCVTPYRVWFSDEKKKLILKDTITDETLHTIKKSSGSHTVNSNGDLIYIDRDRKINSLSYDLRKRTTFFKCEYLHTKWKPLSVHCSPFSGDVLVGMYVSVIFVSSQTIDNS